MTDFYEHHTILMNSSSTDAAKIGDAVVELLLFADRCTQEIEELKIEIADLKHEIYNLKAS